MHMKGLGHRAHFSPAQEKVLKGTPSLCEPNNLLLSVGRDPDGPPLPIPGSQACLLTPFGDQTPTLMSVGFGLESLVLDLLSAACQNSVPTRDWPQNVPKPASPFYSSFTPPASPRTPQLSPAYYHPPPPPAPEWAKTLGSCSSSIRFLSKHFFPLLEAHRESFIQIDWLSSVQTFTGALTSLKPN